MDKSIDKQALDFIIQLGDNALILGHRLSEWCGHAAAIEQDIALSNIALDHVGHARMYYQLAASHEAGKTEDSYAYLRDARAFKNLLILEHENVDFAYTIARSFFYDQFHYLLLEALIKSDFAPLANIAAQAIKEVQYHCRFSAEWLKRLGDGTELSHQKMQAAIDDIYMYTGEFFIPSEADEFMKTNYGLNVEDLQASWKERIQSIIAEATLKLPEQKVFQKGGKQGLHTEKLGLLLAELQFMQRAYPNMEW